MEAPLAIRAWTLLYSQDKALAEPGGKNNYIRLSGNTRLIQISQAVDLPLVMK